MIFSVPSFKVHALVASLSSIKQVIILRKERRMPNQAGRSSLLKKSPSLDTLSCISGTFLNLTDFTIRLTVLHA